MIGRLSRNYRSACLLIAAATFPPLARADKAPTPDESLAALRLADPGLRIELVAAEPEVVGPVAIAWDERGRLYVAEMSDYPVAPPSGRIKRLEDRDGDGRYEHSAVFAEGLPYPSGVLPWNGGVLVTAAPDLLFLKDTDGDGRADLRKVVLTGFAEGNQQLRVNGPTWGLDNWVYLANGRSGGAVRRPDDPADRAVPIPRNDLRVKPATGEFQPVAGFSQFGLPRDDWGDRFPSWNTVPIRHVVLEDRPGTDILDMADGGRIYSLAPAQRRFNAETVSYFNASCGPTIYRGDLLGGGYRGHAFVCEPLTSVVHHRRLDPAGPTFAARRVESGREFLASSHPWFRPVNLTTGPDGALYVVDFCRALVEHPAFVPEPLRSGVDFREGHDRGRIWRILSYTKTSCTTSPSLETAEALVEVLSHPNGWRRDTAQRLLVERADKAVAGPLRDLVRKSPSILARVHALWTLDGLGALDPDTLRAAFQDADPHVREQAVRLATPHVAEYETQLAALADDQDERVRLRVAVALAGRDDDRARGALATLAARDASSPWVASAILGGTGERSIKLLETFANRRPAWLENPTPAQARFLADLAAQVGQRNEAGELAALLGRIASTRSEAASFALLEGVARGQGRARGPMLAWNGKLDGPFREASAGIDRVRALARAAVGDGTRPGWVRVLALEGMIETRDPAVPPVLASLLAPDQPVELQTAAARGVAGLTAPEHADAILAGWDRYTLGTRRILLGSLSSAEPLAARLVEALASGTLAAAEIDPATRESLRRFPGLHDRVEATLPAPSVADRSAVVARYEPALKLVGDAGRGRELFARHCQTCHARNGVGARVGPDLISVAGRPKEDLLVAILDPSREVAPDAQGVVVATTHGQTLTGLVVEETPAAIRLRRAEGLDEVIPRGEIEGLRPTGRSLMPDGLEQVLAPRDVADVIAFLRTADTPPPQARTPTLIRDENAKPGALDWQLTRVRVDKEGFRSPWIEGYCSRQSVKAGEAIDLFVSTDPARRFRVEVFRMGYYGGRGARLMKTLGPFDGKPQPVPKPGPKDLHECRWEPAASLTIPADWPSGVYLGRLTTIADGDAEPYWQSYVVFIVRDERPADILFQCSDNTWQAYNRWPSHYSVYTHPKGGQGPWADVSFDRPYGREAQHDGVVNDPLTVGSGEFLPFEFPLAYWLEENGYDVTYCSNSDMLTPDRGLKCKAFVSVGHDEYWDIRQHDSVRQMRDAGVNLLFLSGNTLCWVAPFRAGADGRPNRILFRGGPYGAERDYARLREKEHGPFPLRGPDEGLLMGVRNVEPVNGGGDWIVTKPEHWIFAGTGMKKGDRIPGLIGWEYHGDPAAIPGLEIVGAGTAWVGGQAPQRWAATIYPGPKGNYVFNASTIFWAQGLSSPPGHTLPWSHWSRPHGPDERVRTITHNLLRRAIR